MDTLRVKAMTLYRTLPTTHTLLILLPNREVHKIPHILEGAYEYLLLKDYVDALAIPIGSEYLIFGNRIIPATGTIHVAKCDMY